MYTLSLDSNSRDLSNHDFLGVTEMTLGEIVGTSQGACTKKLNYKNGRPFKGSLTCRAEEVLNSREFYNLNFKFNRLERGMFTSGKHFVEIRRANEDGSFILIRRSDPMSGSSITWKLAVSGTELHNGDGERALEFRLMKFNRNGDHKIKGKFQTNGEKLKLAGSQWQFSGTKSSCELSQTRTQIKHTFLDYLNGGMEMNFVVAIDFTASNGTGYEVRLFFVC